MYFELLHTSMTYVQIVEYPGQMTATTNITVIIIDLNDHSPVFSQPSYTVYVPENSPIGTVFNNTNITVSNIGLVS